MVDRWHINMPGSGYIYDVRSSDSLLRLCLYMSMSTLLSGQEDQAATWNANTFKIKAHQRVRGLMTLFEQNTKIHIKS